MDYYLFVARSITHAQRMAGALSEAGVPSRIRRAGAGISERGFNAVRRWLGATLEAIESCGCEQGCPSCVHSPKCGNRNEPLSKAGAMALLRAMLKSIDGSTDTEEGAAPGIVARD